MHFLDTDISALGLSKAKYKALTNKGQSNIFEILEDRYGGRSTIFASQLDSKRYHEYLGDPTVADAVCDRLIHNVHRVVLPGPSRRKEEAPIKQDPPASLRSDRHDRTR